MLMFSMIFPLLILILWSFTKNWPWPLLIPKNFGFRGYSYILNIKNLAVLGNSIWLSLIVTVIALLISIPAAKALGVYEFKGKRFFKLLVLAPLVVPQVTIGMGIHTAFIRIGLANTFLGVILAHLIPCMPYGIRILTDVFEITGESLEMQAKVLGASPVQIFTYITLPLIAKGIISAAGLMFIVSFNQYFLTYLIGGGRIVTFPMLMFPYIEGGDRMMASVYSLVFIISSISILFIIERLIKSYYKSISYFS